MSKSGAVLLAGLAGTLDEDGRIELTETPPVSAWFQDGFHNAFLPRFLRRHFHAVAIDRESRDRLGSQLDRWSNQPLLVYANHPSWWDPLIAHLLNRRLFHPRQFYAPIDAEALEQYKVFRKLGFFGVKLNTTRGAGEFLKQSRAILEQPASAVWLTPEGQFCDSRDHRNEFLPGLAHLCQQSPGGVAIPVAMEYVFWDERLPVCLARIGEASLVSQHSDLSKPDWNVMLTNKLRANQERLTELAMERSSEPFENLIRGGRGAGGFYDSFRRLRSLLTGKSFRSQHGSQFE